MIQLWVCKARLCAAAAACVHFHSLSISLVIRSSNGWVVWLSIGSLGHLLVWLFGPAVGLRGPAVRCRSCLCPLPQLSCHSPIRVSAKNPSCSRNTTAGLTYFHLCSPKLLQPTLHSPNPASKKGLPDPCPPPPLCPSQHRSTGAQLSVRAALRPATAGV